MSPARQQQMACHSCQGGPQRARRRCRAPGGRPDRPRRRPTRLWRAPGGARASSRHVDGIERQRSRVGELPGGFGAPQEIIHRLGELALAPVELGRQRLAGQVAVVRQPADFHWIEGAERGLALEPAQAAINGSEQGASSRRPGPRRRPGCAATQRPLGDQRRHQMTSGPGLRGATSRSPTGDRPAPGRRARPASASSNSSSATSRQYSRIAGVERSGRPRPAAQVWRRGAQRRWCA